MLRRTFIATAVAGLAAPRKQVIDTHAHFYDPARAGGTPWPPKDNAVLYRTVLPDEFRALTKPFGVTGVIVVEASPLVEDNWWVLKLAESEPLIVGMVGNLEPHAPGFSKTFGSLREHKKYLGFRYGSLWGRDMGRDMAKPGFIEGMKELAQSGLELDAVGGPAILRQVLDLTDRVPTLRVVIDHLPIDKADGALLREVGQRTQVYCKVSSVLRKVDGRVPEDVGYYRAALDQLWDAFGADRVVYGSNWPVSNMVAPYGAVFGVVSKYFVQKGPEAAEKYFWRNSQAAYRWQDARDHGLSAAPALAARSRSLCIG